MQKLLTLNQKKYHKGYYKFCENGCWAETCTGVGSRFHQKVPLEVKLFDVPTGPSGLGILEPV